MRPSANHSACASPDGRTRKPNSNYYILVLHSLALILQSAAPASTNQLFVCRHLHVQERAGCMQSPCMSIIQHRQLHQQRTSPVSGCSINEQHMAVHVLQLALQGPAVPVRSGATRTHLGVACRRTTPSACQPWVQGGQTAGAEGSSTQQHCCSTVAAMLQTLHLP